MAYSPQPQQEIGPGDSCALWPLKSEDFLQLREISLLEVSSGLILLENSNAYSLTFTFFCKAIKEMQRLVETWMVKAGLQNRPPDDGTDPDYWKL